MKGFPISLAHTTPITLVLWLFYLSLSVIPIVKIPVWKKKYWGGGALYDQSQRSINHRRRKMAQSPNQDWP